MMSKEWKEQLEKIAIGVIRAVAVVVFGPLIKREELKGLPSPLLAQFLLHGLECLHLQVEPLLT